MDRGGFVVIHSGIAENIFLHSMGEGWNVNMLSTNVVNGWLDSPGHRDNMLEANWVFGEVAIAFSDEGRFPASEFIGAVPGGLPPRAISGPVFLITHNFSTCEP